MERGSRYIDRYLLLWSPFLSHPHPCYNFVTNFKSHLTKFITNNPKLDTCWRYCLPRYMHNYFFFYKFLNMPFLFVCCFLFVTVCHPITRYSSHVDLPQSTWLFWISFAAYIPPYAPACPHWKVHAEVYKVFFY